MNSRIKNLAAVAALTFAAQASASEVVITHYPALEVASIYIEANDTDFFCIGPVVRGVKKVYGCGDDNDTQFNIGPDGWLCVFDFRNVPQGQSVQAEKCWSKYEYTITNYDEENDD